MRKDRYYQWLPNTGFDNEIVKLNRIYEEDGVIYYEFSNDEICNESFIAPYTKDVNDLKGKMLVELASKNDIWTPNLVKSKSIMMKDDGIQASDGSQIKEIPPFDDIAGSSDNGGISNSAVGKVRLIPPTSSSCTNVKPIDYKDYMSDEDLYKLGLITEIKKENKEVIKPVVETQECDSINKEENVQPFSVITEKEIISELDQSKTIVETDPVAILVNAAAKNRTVVPMELEIDLPSVDLFNIAYANFENGGDKFIDVILSHIDYAILKDALRTALLSAYSYNLEQEDSEQE